MNKYKRAKQATRWQQMKNKIRRQPAKYILGAILVAAIISAIGLVTSTAFSSSTNKKIDEAKETFGNMENNLVTNEDFAAETDGLNKKLDIIISMQRTSTANYVSSVDTSGIAKGENGELLSGYYKYSPSENCYYEGNVSNGLMHGDGVLTKYRSDNETLLYVYDGEFSNGSFNGGGEYTVYMDDGKTVDWYYNGEWLNGERHGECIVYEEHDNGKLKLSFAGDFLNGKWANKGIQTIYQEDGKTVDRTYDGNWIDGKANGRILNTQYCKDGITIDYTCDGYWAGGANGGWDGKVVITKYCEDGITIESTTDSIWKKGKMINDEAELNDSIENCQVSMITMLDNRSLKNNTRYEVHGGETITIVAASSEADMAFISYYFAPDMAFEERIKIVGGTAEITLPKKDPGTLLNLRVEPVASNDDGTENTVTKTGWQKYTLEYVE